MTTRTVVWVNASNDEDRSRDLDDDRRVGGDDVGAATSEQVTIEQRADMLDSRAESMNAHDVVGMHRLLSAFLTRYLGRSMATTLLWQIAQYDGLDGMNGVCRADAESAYADLGVPEGWNDWQLPA